MPGRKHGAVRPSYLVRVGRAIDWAGVIQQPSPSRFERDTPCGYRTVHAYSICCLDEIDARCNPDAAVSSASSWTQISIDIR